MAESLHASAVLARQIKAERDRVRLAVEALERQEPNGFSPAVADRYVTVRNRFLSVLDDLDAGLTRLLPVKELSQRTWAALSDKRAAVDVMAQETLALVQGWMARQDRTMAEACELADAVLVELTAATGIERAQLTILAGEESFTPRTELIRVRYTISVPWTLPVVAHEFGHLLVQEHRGLLGQWGNLPFQDLFEGKDDEAQRRELFSDMFAVYTTGPAYACTCLLTRFDPSADPQEDARATHPSDAKRAFFILYALNRLRTWDGGLTKAFGDMYPRLLDLWTSTLAELGRPQTPDETAVKTLRARLQRFASRLDAEVDRARYRPRRWPIARHISDGFAGSRRPADLLGNGAGVVDVLNGAWHWRVHNWAAYEANATKYDKRAMELLRAAAS